MTVAIVAMELSAKHAELDPLEPEVEACFRYAGPYAVAVSQRNQAQDRA